MGEGAWRKKGFLEEDRGGDPEREGRSQVGGAVELLTGPLLMLLSAHSSALESVGV